MAMTKTDRLLSAAQEDTRLAYSGHVFDIIVEKVRSARGEEIDAEFLVCEDVVRVYPVDAESTLWLISEKRIGLGADPILRTVSGAIENGESPEEAARRELLEELGMHAQSFEVFHESTPMLKAKYKVHHVAAIGAGHPSRIESSPDPFENIEPRRYALDRIEPLIWEGAFAEDIISFALLVFLKKRARGNGYHSGLANNGRS